MSSVFGLTERAYNVYISGYAVYICFKSAGTKIAAFISSLISGG